jgi:hypothetical protein
MKRKFKQRWSTIPPISTKQTNIYLFVPVAFSRVFLIYLSSCVLHELFHPKKYNCMLHVYIIPKNPNIFFQIVLILFGGKKCELVQQQQSMPKTTIPMPQSSKNGIKFA